MTLTKLRLYRMLELIVGEETEEDDQREVTNDQPSVRLADYII